MWSTNRWKEASVYIIQKSRGKAEYGGAVRGEYSNYIGISPLPHILNLVKGEKRLGNIKKTLWSAEFE